MSSITLSSGASHWASMIAGGGMSPDHLDRSRRTMYGPGSSERLEWAHPRDDYSSANSLLECSRGIRVGQIMLSQLRLTRASGDTADCLRPTGGRGASESRDQKHRQMPQDLGRNLLFHSCFRPPNALPFTCGPAARSRRLDDTTMALLRNRQVQRLVRQPSREYS